MVLIPYFILAAVRAADLVELLAVRCAMAQPLADRNHMRNNGLRYRLFIWDAQLTAGICTSSAPVVHLPTLPEGALNKYAEPVGPGGSERDSRRIRNVEIWLR